MGLFGSSKVEQAMASEIESLSKKNALLQTMFDAWITSLKAEYEKENEPDDRRQRMSWINSHPRDVIEADREMRAQLKSASSRRQRAEIYAACVPELVHLILETGYWVPDLTEDEQQKYIKIMAKLRMYFFMNDPNDIRIGDPPT